MSFSLAKSRDSSTGYEEGRNDCCILVAEVLGL